MIYIIRIFDPRIANYYFTQFHEKRDQSLQIFSIISSIASSIYK